jgi:hypothetical protein
MRVDNPGAGELEGGRGRAGGHRHGCRGRRVVRCRAMMCDAGPFFTLGEAQAGWLGPAATHGTGAWMGSRLGLAWAEGWALAWAVAAELAPAPAVELAPAPAVELAPAPAVGLAPAPAEGWARAA